jgi:hypothetical protein
MIQQIINLFLIDVQLLWHENNLLEVMKLEPDQLDEIYERDDFDDFYLEYERYLIELNLIGIINKICGFVKHTQRDH